MRSKFGSLGWMFVVTTLHMRYEVWKREEGPG